MMVHLAHETALLVCTDVLLIRHYDGSVTALCCSKSCSGEDSPWSPLCGFRRQKFLQYVTTFPTRPMPREWPRSSPAAPPSSVMWASGPLVPSAFSNPRGSTTRSVPLSRSSLLSSSVDGLVSSRILGENISYELACIPWTCRHYAVTLAISLRPQIGG